MDQPAASVAGVPSFCFHGGSTFTENDVLGGGRREEEQQIAQVGSVENEVPNEVKI